MLGWDRRLDGWVVSHRASALDPVFRALSWIGNSGLVWIALALALALLSRRVAVLLYVALADVLAQLSTAAVKLAIARERPDGHALIPEPTSHSFPSGHAASSFACATVLAAFAPRLRWPLLVLAAAIAFSRVYVGVHYPLDVVAGALWGVAIGAAVLALRARLAAGPAG